MLLVVAMMKVVLMQMCTIDTKGQEHTTHAYQCHYFSAAEYPHVHAACLIAAQTAWRQLQIKVDTKAHPP